MPRKIENATPPGTFDLPCACATARRAARALTQMYDQHLRAHGIEGTQFALLEALDGLGPYSQTAIGRGFGLDKTTLSRNLQVLGRQGWVEGTPGQDGRERIYRLTPAGRKQLNAARPAWRRAQAELREAMGATEWDAMWSAFRTVTEVASRSTAGQRGARRTR